MRGKRICPAKEPDIVWCECPAMSPCTLQEFRAMAQPGGKARALAAYMDEVRKRQEEIDKQRERES